MPGGASVARRSWRFVFPTCATRTPPQLLAQGVHPKIVSERLGHASIGIPLDTYGYVMPGMEEVAAEKISPLPPFC